MPRQGARRRGLAAASVVLAVSLFIAVTAMPIGPIPPDANTKGMWSQVVPWPVIGVHSVLLPSGRVLTYGTDTNGRQTGFFTYDVWDPTLGFGADAHLTLPNGTGTDVFCGSQLVLPQSGNVLLAGGDNWTGTGTTNTGNNNSNIFDSSTSLLARANNMNRARC